MAALADSKQRREQARAERKAAEVAKQARAAQRKRMLQLGSVGSVVVVIIAVILIATNKEGSTKPPPPASNEAKHEAATVTLLLRGIPQQGNALGDPKAPVTLQYFGDLECPFCQLFSTGALPKIIERYVRTGKLRVEYLSLETHTQNRETFYNQQIAAYAAGMQNLAWYYIELFYNEQGREGYVTESYLQGLARQVPGLNLHDWTADRHDPALAEELTRDGQIANEERFTGTPSFLIGETGGALHKLERGSTSELSEPQAFETEINKLLRSQGQPIVKLFKSKASIELERLSRGHNKLAQTLKRTIAPKP